MQIKQKQLFNVQLFLDEGLTWIKFLKKAKFIGYYSYEARENDFLYHVVQKRITAYLNK